ncbi:MAG: gamma carbonic anhydrase family protein [Oscillospiraceae bacterium]|nr:gamma carbonic anhydrase family protein [Oscillospiraceae bacterium]
MHIRSFNGKVPTLNDPLFIAPNATITGAVTLGEGSSVWYGAVIRSDFNPITIGRDCNIQDNCTLHSDRNHTVTMGDRVTVGHNALVHGATIEDDVLVGMNSTVLDGAHIGAGSIIAAGAVVLGGTEVPPGSLVAGVPAKVLRPAGEKGLNMIRSNAEAYKMLAAGHAAGEEQ